MQLLFVNSYKRFAVRGNSWVCNNIEGKVSGETCLQKHVLHPAIPNVTAHPPTESVSYHLI